MAGCFAIFALVFLCTDSPVGMQPDDEDASTAALPTVSSWSTPTQRPSTCPEILPQDRVVLFWQSEVGGCEQVPNGVTHVVFGFAQTFGGIVTPSFQGAVASCVQSLRQRCMYVMGVIGGANNNVGMSTIHDPQAFAASVKSFVQQYLLDGVDIDDETSYFEGLYDDHRVRSYMQALHTALKTNGNDYLLSYDAYMLEADPVCWKSARCFAKGVEEYVDWVNVMAYNVDTNVARANQIYAGATKNVFEAWARIVPRDKITMGMCMGGACSYGPGPPSWVVQSWAQYNYASHMGGLMIYAGSMDINTGFETTKQIVLWMRQAAKTFGGRRWRTPRLTTTATTSSTSTTATTRTPAPTPSPHRRDSTVCGMCANCLYVPTHGCYIGWTYDQCTASAFTWCGQ
ncbi:hypothetical protein, variant [Aphanomyces astaci]|uniref:GH18 domain-containing protein n=1 Tax=Aphanomyces astaci TaxID=112090 RepID=W4G123_APHAT|nr:hypothetical protein, variant [Aphanomyces astaci]ETV72613.1 hypothetical protein, variant [Aphanomyces astaci]|eukprot:XP_009837841.1 hypothetical protein, variant [Aphanomyces astaci]